MAKYFKIFGFILLALILFLIQFSGINSWSGFWARCDLILFFIIWLFIFRDFKVSILFSFIIGIIMDIFSFYPFGLYTFSFLLTIVLANFFWQNLFTNRSIYSFLVVSLFITIFYNLFSYFLIYLVNKNSLGISWFGGNFWLNLLLEIVWMFFGVIISFYFLNPKKSYLNNLIFEKKHF
ncbi:MAG TPA: hypothetical protein PLE28_00280 [bacterium]|nr:hypothetical protein [bacterium]